MVNDQPPPSRALRDRWIAAIPVALLLVIAGLQMYTAHTTELSPWKGGGFGMFSTVDVPTERVVELYLIVDGEEIPTAIPDAFQPHKTSLAPMPTDRRTEEMAQALAAESWIALEDHLPEPLQRFKHQAEPASERYLIPMETTHNPQRAIDIDAVRLRVSRLGFQPHDGGSARLFTTPLSDVVVPIGHVDGELDKDS